MKKILLVAVLTLFTFALKAQQYHNGHEYVDLGLSVKWATCNVGATAPEGYGNYYAWGETSPRRDYSWYSYKHCYERYTSLTKYCTQYYLGYSAKADNKTTLELKDDAAHKNWGGKWRMPTRTEMQELIDNCTCEWTTQNDINGCKVISKINGNSIFFPAAGFRKGYTLTAQGVSGSYWSSSLRTDSSREASSLHFDSRDDMHLHPCERCCGFYVRPVCE